MKKIYLDHAATTPVDKEVFEAMKPYFMETFGNASSLHSFGREALEAVENSRKTAADFFGCNPDEIIFTSGATESNNLAIKGIVKAYREKKENWGKKPHIITTAFEHHCVLETCDSLEKDGSAVVSYIKPDENGIIMIEDVEKEIKPNTILVSAMYVNNEIGTVQPIEKIGRVIKEANMSRKDICRIFFHTDATQAINYFDCNVENLGVDLLSMSAHKVYGPKGAGAIYIKRGTAIKSIQDGGAQEYGKRAGTINVPGVVGLGKALEMIKKEKDKSIEKITALRDYLIENILREIPNTRLNGSKEKRSPNNANFNFLGAEGESIILMLDSEGIACSTGSACSSGSLDPSHVLLSLGLRPEETHGSLRISLGKNTTRGEISYVIKKLKDIIKKLRNISGNILGDYYSDKK